MQESRNRVRVCGVVQRDPASWRASAGVPVFPPLSSCCVTVFPRCVRAPRACSATKLLTAHLWTPVMLLASSACPSLTARTRLSNRGEAAGPSSSSRLASAGTPSQRRRAARGPARVSAVISEGVTQTVNRGRFPHFDFLERTYDATHADRLEKYFDTMPFDPFLYKDGHVRLSCPRGCHFSKMVVADDAPASALG